MAWSEAARKAALEARRRRRRVSVDDKKLLQMAPYGKAGQRVQGSPGVTFGMKSKTGKQYFSAKNKKGVLRTGFASLALARAFAKS